MLVIVNGMKSHAYSYNKHATNEQTLTLVHLHAVRWHELDRESMMRAVLKVCLNLLLFLVSPQSFYKSTMLKLSTSTQTFLITSLSASSTPSTPASPSGSPLTGPLTNPSPYMKATQHYLNSCLASLTGMNSTTALVLSALEPSPLPPRLSTPSTSWRATLKRTAL